MQKRQFDPIHGFIFFEDWETDLIQSIPFKRLQGIHQIGPAHFVYSGGCHKRFDHSLGTCFIATQIYDKISKNTELIEKLIPDFGEKERNYWRKILRAASLCHDLGHPPFSHLAETALLGNKGHEEWTMHLIRSEFFKPIWEAAGLDTETIVKISVGESVYEKPFTQWETIVSEILTGDFFGADRIDYLLRDSYFTGLAYGSFDYHQLIDTLRLLELNGRVELGMTEDGLESTYALLLARYFMHKRLYQNPSVKSYSYHLKEVIKQFFEGKPYLDSVEEYIKVNDYDVMSEIHKAFFDSTHKSHDDAKAIMDQKDRVSVKMFTKEEIEHIVDQLGEDADYFSYEKHPFLKPNQGLTFPLLMKNGMVTEAEKVSEVHIPVSFKNWVYLKPNLSEDIRKKFDHAIQTFKQSNS